MRLRWVTGQRVTGGGGSDYWHLAACDRGLALGLVEGLLPLTLAALDGDGGPSAGESAAVFCERSKPSPLSRVVVCAASPANRTITNKLRQISTILTVSVQWLSRQQVPGTIANIRDISLYW